jgi:hypothetical protein
MISELSDDEILDLLMTSEFENNLSPVEFKFLLKKWRYFYRLQNGRLERTKDDLEFQVQKMKDDADGVRKENYKLLIDSAQKDDLIHQMKNRKLTWKERWTGKIITNEDEDK